MRKLKIIFAIGIPFLLSACIREAKNIELPATLSQLGAACFISPEDTSIIVTLSRSQPINQFAEKNKINALKEAIVELSDGEKKVVVPFTKIDYDNIANFVISTEVFPISPGKTYALRVTSKEGEILTAITTVPVNVDTTLTFDIEKIEDTELKGYYDFPVLLQFYDLPETGNYYKVGMKTKFHSPDCPYSGSIFFDQQSNLVNDNNKNGGLIRISNAQIFTSCQPKENDSLQIILANVDYNYYMFFKGLEDNNSNNPFKEPTPIFSNVKGGLGIFCSFRIHLKTMPFPKVE